jgi:hypothetical protein
MCLERGLRGSLLVQSYDKTTKKADIYVIIQIFYSIHDYCAGLNHHTTHGRKLSQKHEDIFDVTETEPS